MRNYHAHLYFSPEFLASARALHAEALLAGIFDRPQLYDRAIGPHPSAMLELPFRGENLARAREWIRDHRASFSVLVHEETGDDVRDHRENIEWFGAPLPIDFGFFELIQKHPEFRIHPETP